jgi:hypothetical protein
MTIVPRKNKSLTFTHFIPTYYKVKLNRNTNRFRELTSNVADLHHFDADSDPDSGVTLMRRSGW